MANIDNTLGFMPVTSPNGTVEARLYYADADGSTALYIGDPVVQEADGGVVIATAGAGHYISGIVIGTYDTTLAPTQYRPASTAGYILVADNPRQLFVAQEDGVGSDLALTSRGSGVDFVAGTGSTINGRSDAQLDSSSLTTATNAQFRIVDIHDIQGNTVGDYCKWIVRINYHLANAGAIGTAV